jgi:hypothetical protein
MVEGDCCVVRVQNTLRRTSASAGVWNKNNIIFEINRNFLGRMFYKNKIGFKYIFMKTNTGY